ncbi:hypothetical protein [Aneurinibacillus tyrosinisolvens]|uniref:hypothetical protein n=1 Tax=Aneurinibacillus tyrosinisolvens TaxID=1443435 RepID=UPI00063F96B2|nr:hypothetical protein [Aneurinibacillus tyrosinisolvens]
MRLWKVLIIMAAFMIMLPISINLLFYTRLSMELNIGRFSLGGFAVLVYLAIPGFVGMIAGLCAALGDRTPSPHQVHATGQTFRYGRRRQLELEMAQEAQQASNHSPAPIAAASVPVQPAIEEPAQPTLTIVPEPMPSQIVTKPTESIVAEANTEEEQTEGTAEFDAMVDELLTNHLAEEEQYSTSEPGEDMTEALASLIKAVSQDESNSQEWTPSLSSNELDRGFDEMLANESQWTASINPEEIENGFHDLLANEPDNTPSHFSGENENEFFNSGIPFHEHHIITQRYGEEIASKITTTPELGPRQFHDVMLVEIVDGEIEYGGKRTRLTGNVPCENGVSLIRGQFVSGDTFRIFSWETVEAVKGAAGMFDSEKQYTAIM